MTTAAATAMAAKLPPGPRRDALLAQLGQRRAPAILDAAPAPARAGGVASFPRPIGNEPNKTERAFMLRLDTLRAAGEVAWYSFNAVRLRLADPIKGGRTVWYKIDFVVGLPGGGVMFAETKGGHITQAGMLRFRMAAQQYPNLRLQMWQKVRGADWACIRDSHTEPGERP